MLSTKFKVSFIKSFILTHGARGATHPRIARSCFLVTTRIDMVRDKMISAYQAP